MSHTCPLNTPMRHNEAQWSSDSVTSIVWTFGSQRAFPYCATVYLDAAKVELCKNPLVEKKFD